MKTLFGILRDHFIWKHQIFKLAKSDIIKTYSGTAFGWGWALVKPTVTIVVFWFVLTVGFRAGATASGDPYILWLIAGLIPWFYMDEMITGGTSAYLTYSYLITKMKFPVSTITTFIGISKLIVHLFLMIIVLIIFAVYGYYPDIYLLQLPLYMALMFIFFSNWALFAAMLSAISKDFMNFVVSFVTAVFWLSGILFDVRMINTPWIRTVLMFNPVTFCAEGYRDVFLYKVWIWEEPVKLLTFSCTFVVMVILAVWSYKKLYKEIPDVL
ncbi:MAG: ABC transporter permease [Clostridiales Family XIII bacterium]|nr:ABC transporter permease [Clostridiales Family XIII bacterium]